MADSEILIREPAGMDVEQKVFMLAFTGYTCSRLANELVATGADNTERCFHGPGADDVFPAWTEDVHALDIGKGQVVRTNNMRELNKELAEGWRIRHVVPQHDVCACLIVMERVIRAEEETENMKKNKSTTFVDPDLGKPGWYARAIIRAIRNLLRIRFAVPPVVHTDKHRR